MMAKKRGNGEESIYRRTDGRWVGQYQTRAVVAEKLTKAWPIETVD